MYTVADIKAEYRRLDALTGVDSSGIRVSLSARAVKRLGVFRPGNTPSIIISAHLLNDPEQFWDTVRHEYAHAVVWLRHPEERHGHDALWKAVCREVGCTPKATAAPDDHQQELRRQRANYRLVCDGCGQETLYLREGKIVSLARAGKTDRIRCARCDGRAFTLYERDDGDDWLAVKPKKRRRL